MTSFINQQIAPPKNWQDFEDLCADLWSKIWNDENTQKNGRTGQPQHGIDVYGRTNGNGEWQGVQCKGKDGRYGQSITKNELRDEIEKAKKFDPPIKNFILATTAPNDATIQEEARKLTDRHNIEDLFSVQVFGWDEIQRRLSNYPEIIEKHFPDQAPSMYNLRETFDRFFKQYETKDKEFSNFSIDVADRIISTLKKAGALPSLSDDKVNPAEKAINQEIDTYRDLINDKPHTALKLLISLKDRCWKQVSDQIKFRIITNIGATNFALGNTEDASNHFFEAEKFAPEVEKAVHNVTLANLLKENDDIARKEANRAIKMNPDSSQGYALLIAAHAVDDNVKDLQSLVPEDKIQNPEISFALGHAYRRRKEVSKACEWLKFAYEKNTGSREFRVSYAETILYMIFENPAVAVGGQLSSEDRVNLNQAVQLLEDVWHEVQDTELAASYSSSAINLCNAYKLLEYDGKAKTVLEAVIKVCPRSPDVRKLAAHFSFETGSPEEACDHLLHIQKGTDPEIDLMLAEALTKATRFDDAFKQIEGLELPEDRPILKSVSKGLKLRLLLETKGQESGLEYAKELGKKYSKDVFINVALARFYRSLGEIEVSANKAIQAASYLPANASYREKLFVADMLYDLHQFEKALELYKDLVTSSIDSHLLRRLLVCFYNTDQRKAALQILEKVADEDKSKNFFRRFSAKLYFRIGDLKKAKEEAEAYLQSVPNDLEFRLNWISILQRQGNDAAINDFLSLNPEYSEAQPELQMHLAHLYHYYGYLDNSLKLAYKLLRAHYGNADIHIGYMGLLLIGRFDKDTLKPNIIGENTAFTVKNEYGEQKTFIIECELTDRILNEEIGKSHPIVKEAIGKSKGEKFIYKQNPFQEENWEIMEVKSKYIHLLHKSAEEYSSRFPEEQNFWKVTLKPKDKDELDFTPIFKSIDERHSHVKQVEEFYTKNPVPIGSIAQLLGAKPLDVWRGFMRLGRVPIKCCLGNEHERNNAITLLRTHKKGLVIDPLTLFSVCSLSIQDELTEQFGRFGITQSTLDLYNDHIESIKLHPPSGVIGRKGDKYVFEEYSQENIQMEINKLREAFNWAEKNCDILPAVGARDLAPEMLSLSEIMHPSFIDIILAASGSEMLLLSDDMHLRILAKNLMGIDGIWLQVAMLVAAEQKTISMNKYSEAVANLIDANMEFISINAEVLRNLAEMDDWSTSKRFMKTIETLGRSNVELNSVINVASDFMIIIWKSPLTFSQMEGFTYTLLNSIRVRRNLNIIRYLLRVVIELSVPVARIYKSAIEKWCKGHAIAG